MERPELFGVDTPATQERNDIVYKYSIHIKHGNNNSITEN